MQRLPRKPHDAQFQIERLQKKHLELDEQIATLDGQRFLNTQETVQMHELKKAKLAAKDELLDLRRRTSG